MMRRALDFATAHPIADAGFTAVFTRLSGQVTRADALVVQESAGITEERAARARRVALRKTVYANYLARLVRLAEKAARTKPELVGMFRRPSGKLTVKEFLVAANQLLAAAIPEKDLFLSLGVGDHFFEELSAAVTELDAETRTAHEGSAGHIGARAELKGIAKDATSEIAILGTFYRASAPDDLELLAAWKSASKVAGPFKRVQVEVPGPAPAPVPAPVPTPVPVV